MVLKLQRIMKKDNTLLSYLPSKSMINEATKFFAKK